MRAALLSSAKERAENIMIVDLLRNDLGRLAQPGKVHVEALCAAEAYPDVLADGVNGGRRLARDRPGRIVRRAVPLRFDYRRAEDTRHATHRRDREDSPRGLYTGALGWLAPGGDCRFSVAIRTIEG
jgi:anthranilate/para-aminobenzoate synthase component I